MSSKGKPLNPQRQLNPALERGVRSVGQTGVWDGQKWAAQTPAATIVETTVTSGITITLTSGDPVDTPAEISVRIDPGTGKLYVFDGTAWWSYVGTKVV